MAAKILTVIGDPNPNTANLVRLRGLWFWPCNAWLKLEAEFGETVLLNAAGNADWEVLPHSLDEPRMRKACRHEARVGNINN
jgi:hypothetical protein